VEALDGFLMQNTNFEYEVILCDDCSTDSTKSLVEEYIKNHTKGYRIKYFRHEKNLGMIENVLFSFNQCTAKYVALCEGDDFWTDPCKLQRQVDFLEANEEYAICFTAYKIRNELNNQQTINDSIFGSFTIEDIIKGNSFSTASVVFVSKYFNPQIEWFLKMPFGDWTLYLVILFQSEKKAYCLKDITSVYRIHLGGIHGNLHSSNLKLVTAYKMHIQFYRSIKKYLFKDDYGLLIKQEIKNRKDIIYKLLRSEGKNVSALLSKWY